MKTHLVWAPFSQQMLRHFLNKQTHDKLLPGRFCVCGTSTTTTLAGAGAKGGGGREVEKAASDSPLLSDSPLRITLGDPGVGEVRRRGVSFLSQVHWGSRGGEQAGWAVIVKVEWRLLIKPGAGNRSSLHLRSGEGG